MKKTTKMNIYRTIVQILFLIFLPGLITLAFSQFKILFVAITTGNYTQIIPNCIVLIILSVLTAITGRIFCGWMCIFGSLNDWIHIVSNKIFKINYKVDNKVDKYLKYVKYLVLIAIISLVWTGILNLPNGSSPWDAYTQIFDLSYLLNEYLIGTFILLLIVIGAMFIERFFCRYLCPLGAIFAILSKFKIYKVHKESSACGKCRACTLKCSMGIDLSKVEKVNSSECIQCFNCVNICPRNNARVKVLGEEVNEAALAAVAITGTIGVYSLSNAIISSNLVAQNNTNIVKENKASTNESTNQDEVNNNNTTIDTTSDTNSGASSNITSNTTTNSANSSTTNSTSNSTTTTTTTSQKYKDGTYTGIGRGYRPNLTVSVTIKNDKITNVEIVSCDETPGYYEVAAKVVPNEIIQSQSTDVDVVSGATRTSNGIMSAVNSALTKAEL